MNDDLGLRNGMREPRLVVESDGIGASGAGQSAIDRAHIMIGREGRQQLPADPSSRANQADIHRAVPFWI
ncbi:hypothetical protein D1872_329840 [compost metagenome]